LANLQTRTWLSRALSSSFSSVVAMTYETTSGKVHKTTTFLLVTLPNIHRSKNVCRSGIFEEVYVISVQHALKSNFDVTTQVAVYQQQTSSVTVEMTAETIPMNQKAAVSDSVCTLCFKNVHLHFLRIPRLRKFWELSVKGFEGSWEIKFPIPQICIVYIQYTVYPKRPLFIFFE